MDYLYYTSLAICINFLIAGIFLFYLKTSAAASNKLFGTILLLNAYVNAIVSLCYFRNFASNSLNLFNIYSPVEFAIPPLFYFYFKTLFRLKIKLNRTAILHFIPSAFLLLFSVICFILPAGIKHIVPDSALENINSLYIPTTLFYIQFSIYLLIIFSKIIRNQKIQSNKEEPGSIENKQVSELMIIIGIAFMLCFAAVIIRPYNVTFSPVIYPIAYYIILYVILFKPGLLNHSKTNHSKENNNNKIQTNFFKKEEENILIEKIINLMTIEKIYLDNHISLNGLADKIQIPYYQLSRLINHNYNLNFNDFINSMRVEEAKKKLLDEQYKRLTIEAIGQSVGFNSKSSFYIAFKKYTHCSPKEYMKTNSKDHLIWSFNRSA
jgi:AraC-like DNA-binding protein